MKSRLVMLMSLAIAALSIVLAAGHFSYTLAPSVPPAARASLPTKPSSYLGVYEAGTPSSYAQIAAFGSEAGRKPNLAGYFSGWAEPFDGAFAATLHAHGITPLIQIDPTDANIKAIADGVYDGYLRSYANSVRAFGRAVVIGFGQEMNADWYPWGYTHVAPAVFINAWRHLVTIFRNQGADNVTWLWTLQADQPGTGPIASWWPGAAYVTWVGVDGFYNKPADTFSTVFSTTISQVRALTDKPVLLSETGVAPRADQIATVLNLFEGARKAGTLGLVWFDIAQTSGVAPHDWRIEDSPTLRSTVRLGINALFGRTG